MIGHVGACLPVGPCVVPVGFGLYAPSGVLLVGVALCLRDAVQRLAGRTVAGLAVLVGAGLSLVVAPAALAVASAAAFAVSELADGFVYGWAEKRGVARAVLLSGAVGLLLDSVLFLGLAFGSLDYLGGQLLGKAWAVLLASAAVASLGRWRAASA